MNPTAEFVVAPSIVRASPMLAIVNERPKQVVTNMKVVTMF